MRLTVEPDDCLARRRACLTVVEYARVLGEEPEAATPTASEPAPQPPAAQAARRATDPAEPALPPSAAGPDLGARAWSLGVATTLDLERRRRRAHGSPAGHLVLPVPVRGAAGVPHPCTVAAGGRAVSDLRCLRAHVDLRRRGRSSIFSRRSDVALPALHRRRRGRAPGHPRGHQHRQHGRSHVLHAQHQRRRPGRPQLRRLDALPPVPGVRGARAIARRCSCRVRGCRPTPRTRNRSTPRSASRSNTEHHRRCRAHLMGVVPRDGRRPPGDSRVVIPGSSRRSPRASPGTGLFLCPRPPNAVAPSGATGRRVARDTDARPGAVSMTGGGANLPVQGTGPRRYSVRDSAGPARSAGSCRRPCEPGGGRRIRRLRCSASSSSGSIETRRGLLLRSPICAGMFDTHGRMPSGAPRQYSGAAIAIADVQERQQDVAPAGAQDVELRGGRSSVRRVDVDRDDPGLAATAVRSPI